MNPQLPDREMNLLAELVHGEKLPMPALDLVHIEIILELLQKAYEGIKADYPSEVSTARESYLNSLMVDRLNHLVETDPLASQLVRAVSRGSELKSYDAQQIEKRPDIQISLTSRQHRFPLVVECKILDRSRGQTTSLYCKKGLARFIAGEYSWTDSEAMMLAYVRDGSCINAHLHPFLSNASKALPSQYETLSFPQKCFSLPDAAKTKHRRPFTYTHGEQVGESPGDILIWHLWVC